MTEPAHPTPDVWPLPETNAAALESLRPRLRKVVEATDPEMLGAFDAAYTDATVEAVDTIKHGSSGPDELSGEQELGLAEAVRDSIVAFMINVAASIAVAHVEGNYHQAWAWIAHLPAQPAAMGEASTPDAVATLFAHLGLTEQERARAIEQFRSDPGLVRALQSCFPR